MPYYADTAYDSSHPRDLPPAPPADTLLQRSAKKYAISGKGLACHEYMANGDLVDILEQLKDPTPNVLEQLKQPAHEYLKWGSFKNPAIAVEMFGYLALAFGWGGGGGSLLLVTIMSLFKGDNLLKDSWLTFVIIILVCHAIYKLCSTAVKQGWVKDRNNIIFNRRTGQITFTWKRKRVSYPFDEFDVAVQHVVGYAGNVNYHLFFIHRYSQQFFRSPEGAWNLWETELDREFYQHYMDTARPLPDVPQLESFRNRDPVTAAYDKQHGRPKNYWLDMPIEKARAMHKAARAAAETFPWGLTREQAIAVGWQPSGVGEGDWQQKGQDSGQNKEQNKAQTNPDGQPKTEQVSG